MPYTKKELDFIKYVKTRCKEHGVKCILRNTNNIKASDTIMCSGYFNENVPELVCAMKHHTWIEVLAHEYSHLTQWVENIPIWQQADVSLTIVEDWLKGVDYKDINKHINVNKMLELDNEKRTVKIIQKLELDVDIDRYIRTANAYVQFYNWIKQTRRWMKPNNTIHDNERIISAMPAKFNMDYTKIPKRIEKIFREENI